MNHKDQKIYKGFCDPIDNKSFVYVDGESLDDSFNLLNIFRDVVYDWGSHGFGSLKLSFAIIKDYTGDAGLAIKYYEDFERFVISRIKPRAWTMCGLFIKGWLETLGGYDD